MAPLYRTIAEQLLNEFSGGNRATDIALPSEASLQRAFRVSRTTVRKALAELQSTGMVATRRGIGSHFLADKINKPISSRVHFRNEERDRGVRPKTRVELVERPIPRPDVGQVLISVEACGICGADAGDIENADPALQPPRVPGHEVVGRIAAIGPNGPSIWRIGQRVGVGRKGGHCLECRQCRAGRFHLCPNQPTVGASCDGGYAEMMVARATGLSAIPDELSSEEAAPILCAGIATFNALKKCGAEAGDTVAVFGIGGLGHMALQYARRMGFRVIAITGSCPRALSV